MNSEVRLGMTLMILAALSFACGDVGVKVLGQNLSPWQIAGGRALLGLVITLFMARFRLRGFIITDWPWQILLGLSSTLGLICTIMTLKLLPLSVAFPLLYLYPALGALMSPLINREKPSGSDWLAIALAFGGVILLAHGVASQKTAGWAGVGWALGSAFFVGLFINLTRRQAKSHPLRVILFYLCLVNVLICLPATVCFDQPVIPAGADLMKLFFFIAPTLLAGIFLLSVGYKYINAHRGGVIQTLEVVFGSLYGVLFLSEPLTLLVMVGSGLMMASALTIALGR